MIRAPSDRKPDWRAVTYEAVLDPTSLLRVLAGMSFHAHLGTVTRGAIKWWQPDYLTASAKSPLRASFAAANRAMRDAEVHLLADGRAVTAVCSYQGEWRTADGAQRGDDLASLGAMRWSMRYGQAAAKIARIIGIRIPSIETLDPRAVFAEVYARIEAARVKEAG